MSALPNNTPKSILVALHKEKMRAKHFRRMERGVTDLEQQLERMTPAQKKLAFENVSKRVQLERAAAARKQKGKK